PPLCRLSRPSPAVAPASPSPIPASPLIPGRWIAPLPLKAQASSRLKSLTVPALRLGHSARLVLLVRPGRIGQRVRIGVPALTAQLDSMRLGLPAAVLPHAPLGNETTVPPV